MVIANQFLYQNTPYGTLMSPNLNCGLATQLSLINLNLNSAIFKYVAFQLKGKMVIANQFLYQNTPQWNLISPNMNCDLVTQLSLSNLNLKSAIFKYVTLRQKVKVIITNQFLYQNTPYGTLVSPNVKMQLFDPIITFKCSFKVCHIFHYIEIQGR